jgi:hypothetical protein
MGAGRQEVLSGKKDFWTPLKNYFFNYLKKVLQVDNASTNFYPNMKSVRFL